MNEPPINYGHMARELETLLSARCLGFCPGFSMHDPLTGRMADIPFWLAERILGLRLPPTASEGAKP